jgi:putative addiction module component (TIGR02574 family)
MSPLLEQLKATVSNLPAPERAELAHFLLETLEPAEEGVAEAWKTELTRRMADIARERSTANPLRKCWLVYGSFRACAKRGQTRMPRR